MVDHVNFICSIAESLRGPFKPSKYGSIVFPFIVLRRLDAVLADAKAAVLEVAPAVFSDSEMLPTVARWNSGSISRSGDTPFATTAVALLTVGA